MCPLYVNVDDSAFAAKTKFKERVVSAMAATAGILRDPFMSIPRALRDGYVELVTGFRERTGAVPLLARIVRSEWQETKDQRQMGKLPG